ncbi:MAG: hypothetical protein KGN36_16930 [Acidobacteriota bacterium]|nr:hypothetical protein [Acidobacteriota bacterium]
MMRIAGFLFIVGCASAQVVGLPIPRDALALTVTKPLNLDFETGDAGHVPPDWSVEQTSRLTGYAVALSRTGCHGGTGCGVMAAGPRVKRNDTGLMVQAFSAAPYRGKRMRLRAWVKLDATDKQSRIRLLFVTDGAHADAGFMDRRGANAAEWSTMEITGTVPFRADMIHIAIALMGKGRAWIDDVSFEEAGEAPCR